MASQHAHGYVLGMARLCETWSAHTSNQFTKYPLEVVGACVGPIATIAIDGLNSNRMRLNCATVSSSGRASGARRQPVARMCSLNRPTEPLAPRAAVLAPRTLDSCTRPSTARMQAAISPPGTGSTSFGARSNAESQASLAPGRRVEERDAPQQHHGCEASDPSPCEGGRDAVCSRLRASTGGLERIRAELNTSESELAEARIEPSALRRRIAWLKEEATAQGCGDATDDADRKPEAVRKAAEGVTREQAVGEDGAREQECRAAAAEAAVVQSELATVGVELACSREAGRAMQRTAQSALAAAEAWGDPLTRERDVAIARAQAAEAVAADAEAWRDQLARERDSAIARAEAAQEMAATAAARVGELEARLTEAGAVRVADAVWAAETAAARVGELESLLKAEEAARAEQVEAATAARDNAAETCELLVAERHARAVAEAALARVEADAAAWAADAVAAARDEVAEAREALESERHARAVAEAALARVQAEAVEELSALHAALSATGEEVGRAREEAGRVLKVQADAAAGELSALHAALSATGEEVGRVREEMVRMLRVGAAMGEAEAETRRAAAAEVAAAHAARVQVGDFSRAYTREVLANSTPQVGLPARPARTV